MCNPRGFGSSIAAAFRVLAADEGEGAVDPWLRPRESRVKRRRQSKLRDALGQIESVLADLKARVR
jgi:hypothetical protein